MKTCLVKAEFNYFNYKFKSPIKFKNEILSQKEGYFLNLFDQDGYLGVGELSPLKGFSKNTLGQLKDVLEQTLLEILETPFNLKDLDFKVPLFNLFKTPSCLDSNILFCLEGALLSWLENSHPKILKKFFGNKDFNFSVPLNGLLLDQDINEAIKSWECTGLTNIKMKIGRKPLREELSLIWEIYRKTQGKIKLRLDANQNFNREDFHFFAKNLPLEIIDYIEDPISDFDQIQNALTGFKVPIAIDENIIALKNKTAPFVSSWIIKPSLVGGYSKAIELIEDGAKKEITAVISSGFETNLSLRYLALLAQYQNSFKETPCGLDTFRYLINDNNHKVPYIENGKIHF